MMSTSLTLTKPRALIGLHSFPDHKTHGLGCQFSLSFHLHLALPWYHILTECLSMPGFLYFWGCFFMSLALLLNKEGRKRKAGLCPPNIIPASRTGSSWAGLSLFADIHQNPNLSPRFTAKVIVSIWEIEMVFNEGRGASECRR